ncbi:GNAT family N-acetyltransferase [Alicyclobacillus fastidiosus]|uniref:GNAT family N-acetyltransferase n=1 Tax=Alicyclobacillus fastidiosus TaxID=392011 RepID=A0ABV5AIR0_9BACL|nr:GNAT family N-acetyltransferase [Alicyclobacillus fastidiosus]WEH07785.1 GNAT family N-acetyltransferase [Alicyclobacillus fastidiosus]
MYSNWIIRRATLDDATGVARVHVDSWRTTYRGIVNDDFLASLSYAQSEERWQNRLQDHSSTYVMFVAEDNKGQIIGFADGGPERSGHSVYDGELYAIYLLEAYQRKGIGKQLFHSVVSHLIHHHFHEMLIWVLTDNPACRFYESMGGQIVDEKSSEIGAQTLSEVAYGWEFSLR